MRLTETQAIDLIKNYVASGQPVTQNRLRKLTNMSEETLKRLADTGAFKWPPKVPKGKAHLYVAKNKWRTNFKLKGSL